MKRDKTHKEFCTLVRKHAIKHYGGLNAWSRAINGRPNTLSRAISGELLFPDSVLEELGYEMEKIKVYTKCKKVE